MDTVERLVGRLPHIDFALVSLCRTLNLPSDAALVWFAIGRTVGWIARSLEQHAEGRLIRPRAQYIGVRPGSSLRETSNRDNVLTSRE
jgi:citrate synthase